MKLFIVVTGAEGERREVLDSATQLVWNVGRHTSNHIQIPDLMVSRYQCRILYNDGGWTIIDGQLMHPASRNGMLINGKPKLSAPLQHGDVIDLSGRVTLRVEYPDRVTVPPHDRTSPGTPIVKPGKL